MSRRRRFVLLVLGAFAVLVAFAPRLARTALARRFVANRISESLGRAVEIGDLDAGWTSGVTLRGLVIRNDTAEFRGEPLLEADSVRLESALPSLVLSGASDVSVDGLVLRLEEQAGGRTNIDDLVAGFAKPAPAPPPTKREARPFRFRLTDASIRVRRLVPRPQPRPVDPFREDPVILGADEGLLVLGIDDMDLLLATAPGESRIDLTATVTAGGSAGRAELAVRLGAQGPSGTLHLSGIDLALLRPFVKGIEGRVEIRAEGSPDGAQVKVRAEALKAGPLDEEWAELAARVKKEEGGVSFDALSVRTASGAFSLDGRGAWPPRGLEIRASASTEALGLRVKGPLVLEARGEGSALTGTLATPDASATFDALFRDGGVEIRSLEAKARESSLSLKGEVAGAVRLSGHADVSLADLAPLLPEGASLKGRLRVGRFALEDLSLKADATVEGLLARGLFAEDLRIDRGELHVDAALSKDGDVLTVTRAQLDDLAAEGTVSGLARGSLRADGTVRGTIEINPLHARLLGIREVRGLRGRVTVDAKASSAGRRIDGTATIDGFHVETSRGAWDLARIAATGSYRDGNASLDANADGLRLVGSLEAGKGHVVLDVDAIERQPLLVEMLPKGLAVAGPLRMSADVAGEPWDIRGTLESAALTASLDGRGIAREPLRLSFGAREGERGWAAEISDLVLGNLGVRANVRDGFVGADGSMRARVHVECPLDRVAKVAPEAASFEPRGNIGIDAEVLHDGRWSVEGGLQANDASLLISGKRGPPRTARLDFDAVSGRDGAWTVRSFRISSRTTDIEGSGAVGHAITLRAEGRARVEEIAPYVPAFRGSGEVTFDEIALDVSAEGELVASASFRTQTMRVEGAKLTSAAGRTRIEGRLRAGALEDVRADVSFDVARAERGNILAEGVSIREKGGGRSGAYSLGTRIDAAHVVVGATSWEKVGLDVRGRLDNLLGDRVPTGINGAVTFARWNVGPFHWEDAKGDVAIEDGNLVVRNLVAGLEGGTVRAEGRLVPAGDRLGWRGAAHAEGIVLSEEIGRPLSFIVPILRVKKAGTLSGRADIDIRLAADDTTDAAILRTLVGSGSAHLYDIEVKSSLLLPLLSLRLDKAILQGPYRFKDLKVAFDVGHGAIRPQPFELKATPFGIEVKEVEVGLDGSVNALIVPGILPFRVHGTLDDPKVRPAPLAPFR